MGDFWPERPKGTKSNGLKTSSSYHIYNYNNDDNNPYKRVKQRMEYLTKRRRRWRGGTLPGDEDPNDYDEEDFRGDDVHFNIMGWW